MSWVEQKVPPIQRLHTYEMSPRVLAGLNTSEKCYKKSNPEQNTHPNTHIHAEICCNFIKGSFILTMAY